MPYSSTTNLLTAVNRVLLDVGERSVGNFTGIPAKKALGCILQALVLIQASHKWEWLYDRIPGSNWILDTCMVDASEVRGVAWNTGVTFSDVQYIDARQYDLQQITGFDSSTTLSNRPNNYTQTAYQTYRVNPYPTDSAGQQKLLFYVKRNLIMPGNTTDFLPIPEKFMELVYLKADYLMCCKHLEDFNSAQMYDKEYQMLLHRYQQDENKTPTGGFNMYKPRFRRFYS